MLALIAMLFTALLWSTSGLFIKLLDWNPMCIAGGRSILAALLIFIVRLTRRNKIEKRSLQSWGWTIAAGVAYALTMIFFVVANRMTTSANAILLQYTAPVWAALLGWLVLKERPSWQNWCSLSLVFLGMMLFFRDGLVLAASAENGPAAATMTLGNVIALVSGISFGANAVFMRKIKEGDPADAMLIAHIITGLVSLPFFFDTMPAFTGPSIASILFMGFLQIGLASLLFSYGIKRIPAVQAMLICMIEPLMNPVWVFLAIGETISASTLIGGMIIILAVLFSQIRGSRQNHLTLKS
ncbi:MAG: DMT family transporter [Spirochaetaceae bacterium]|jgi:drug/metabolite transporter (DMT)-like permease|nr:DMT family transporter [Spirochaetaceae bacterium]